MFEHILLPTDGSELSERAIYNGVAMAKALGARADELFAVSPQVQKVEIIASTPFKG